MGNILKFSADTFYRKQTDQARAPKGAGNIVGCVGQNDVAIRHLRQFQRLTARAGETTRGQWACCKTGLDSAILRLKAPARAHLSRRRLLVSGTGMFATTVDAGI